MTPPRREVRYAIARVRANSRWEHDNEPYFEGEVEPCINGRAVAIGAYFGVEAARHGQRGVTDRADGRWRLELRAGERLEPGIRSIRQLMYLEGLLEFERAGGGGRRGSRRPHPWPGIPARARAVPSALDWRGNCPQ